MTIHLYTPYGVRIITDEAHIAALKAYSVDADREALKKALPFELVREIGRNNLQEFVVARP